MQIMIVSQLTNHRISLFKKKSRNFPKIDFQALEQRFIQSLAKFDAFLKTKLDDETNSRLFIDSNKMTLADCNLLPKLHVALTAARERRDFEIPEVSFNQIITFQFFSHFNFSQNSYLKTLLFCNKVI